MSTPPTTLEAARGLRDGDLARAEQLYREVLAADPHNADAAFLLGRACQACGKPGEALESFEQAVRLQADHAEAHKNRAMAWLQLGEFERGWAEYEWRWRCQGVQARPYRQPAWDGSSLDGRRILLHTEQGLGDVIQFIRYAPLVRGRGAVVFVACPPPLVPLLRTCPGVAQVVGHDWPLPEFDCHAPLLSLPRLMGTSLATVPADVPYLSADPELAERWGRELGAVRGCKVGVVWGGSGDPSDPRLCFSLADLAPLAAVPGVELFSLQKGRETEQLAEVVGRFRVTDLGSRLDLAGGAFTGAAAVLRNLDLVVACDAACAHLAGALGVPVWVALSCAADWRWLLGREDSPWYPSMRLFRQPRLGDWAAVFTRMAEELRRLVGERRRAGTVTVEVSPGELIDKLTILQIKRERITDEGKLAHVRAELAALQAACERDLASSHELARLTEELRGVNEALWQVEDELRRCERARDFGTRFVDLARSVYHHNDARAALKRKVSELLGATFSEQKDYVEYQTPG